MSKELKPIEAAKASLPELVRLVQLHMGTGVDAQVLAMQEIEYLRVHALTNPAINDVHPQTVPLALKDIIKKNLSLDPGLGLVYVKTRNVVVGKDQQGKDIKIKALELQPSANGKLSIARQCGRVLDHKRPEVRYDAAGVVIEASVELLVPSVPEPRWEKFTFGLFDFERWRRASHKDRGRWKDGYNAADPNFTWANEHYTSWRGGPDPEFVRAKALRHALGKLGTNPSEVGRYKPTGKFVPVDLDPAKDEPEYTEAEVVETSVQEAVAKNEVVLPNADDL